jgi:hypothetical protein
MSDCAFQAKRTIRTYRQTINAKPEIVFPLLCPVREAEWLDGWYHTMIYSVSGLVEEGAVFSTSNPGEEDTVWMVTRHDRAARVVEFVRITPHSRTCLLKIAVSALGDDRSHVDISYTYTSIGTAGNRLIELWSEREFLDAVTFWEKSMNHFLRTGEKLSRVAEPAAASLWAKPDSSPTSLPDRPDRPDPGEIKAPSAANSSSEYS